MGKNHLTSYMDGPLWLILRTCLIVSILDIFLNTFLVGNAQFYKVIRLMFMIVMHISQKSEIFLTKHTYLLLPKYFRQFKEDPASFFFNRSKILLCCQIILLIEGYCFLIGWFVLEILWMQSIR